MLKKLIKHEIKTVWRFLAMAAVCLVCLTLVGVVGIHILYPETVHYTDGFPGPGTYAYNGSYSGGSVSIGGGTLTALFASLYIMAYIAGAFLLSAGTYIYLWMHFHNTMYGHQGYLTNTLPTTPAKLILSKLITAASWMLISITMLIGSIWSLNIAVRSASGLVYDDSVRIFGFWQDNWIGNLVMLIQVTLFVIFAIITGILMMYGSSALGQLSKRNRGFAAIAYYFAMTMIVNVISTITLAIMAWILNRKDDGVFFHGLNVTIETIYTESGEHAIATQAAYISRSINWIAFVLTILIITGAVVLYYITHHITSKNLNLE